MLEQTVDADSAIEASLGKRVRLALFGCSESEPGFHLLFLLSLFFDLSSDGREPVNRFLLLLLLGLSGRLALFLISDEAGSEELRALEAGIEDARLTSDNRVVHRVVVLEGSESKECVPQVLTHDSFALKVLRNVGLDDLNLGSALLLSFSLDYFDTVRTEGEAMVDQEAISTILLLAAVGIEADDFVTLSCYTSYIMW